MHNTKIEAATTKSRTEDQMEVKPEFFFFFQFHQETVVFMDVPRHEKASKLVVEAMALI